MSELIIRSEFIKKRVRPIPYLVVGTGEDDIYPIEDEAVE